MKNTEMEKIIGGQKLVTKIYAYPFETDEWGTLYNHSNNYIHLAAQILEEPIFFAWTDEEGSQLDILLCLNPRKTGLLQAGLGDAQLFISVSRIGCFGFDLSSNNLFPSYVGEKLNLRMNLTTDKLTELLNGVIKELNILLKK